MLFLRGFDDNTPTHLVRERCQMNRWIRIDTMQKYRNKMYQVNLWVIPNTSVPFY